MKVAFPELDGTYAVYDSVEAQVKGFMPMFGAILDQGGNEPLTIVRWTDGRTYVCSPAAVQNAWMTKEAPGEPVNIQDYPLPTHNIDWAGTIVRRDDGVLIMTVYIRVGVAVGILEQPEAANRPDQTTEEGGETPS